MDKKTVEMFGSMGCDYDEEQCKKNQNDPERRQVCAVRKRELVCWLLDKRRKEIREKKSVNTVL